MLKGRQQTNLQIDTSTLRDTRTLVWSTANKSRIEEAKLTERALNIKSEDFPCLCFYVYLQNILPSFTTSLITATFGSHGHEIKHFAPRTNAERPSPRLPGPQGFWGEPMLRWRKSYRPVIAHSRVANIVVYCVWALAVTNQCLESYLTIMLTQRKLIANEPPRSI